MKNASGINAAVSTDRPRSLRVLIIEDHRDVAHLTKHWLEMHGHQVRTAASGETGLELAVSFNPAAVLCNIELAGHMNGYEVAEAICRTSRPKPVLIAFTGDGQAEDYERTKLAGFDLHLVKPVDPEILLSALLGERATK